MLKQFTSVMVGVLLLPSLAAAQNQPALFDAMDAKLKYLSQRQAVLSRNIANANTPAYKAQEVESPNFSKQAQARQQMLQLTTTSPMHIHSQGRPNSFRTVADSDAYETKPDGNNVALEQQMVKMSDTSLDHRETISMMRKMEGLMKLAVGGSE